MKKKKDERFQCDITENTDNTININLTCKKCGAPVDHSDEYGVWCTNECDREESIEASIKLKKMFPFLFPDNE